MSFRVLLVNAGTQTERLFREAVEAFGAELVALDGAEAAAQRILGERFEAIFLDTVNAAVSRQGLIQLIRKSRLNSQVAIVLLTDYQGSGTVTGEAPGGASHLVRPTTTRDLQPLLQELRKKIRADRRKHRRLSFRAAVNCLHGARRFRATSFNLSLTGMLVDMSVPFELGDEWEVRFLLAADEPAFHARARVVRAEGPNRVGLRFQNLENPVRQRLQQFLDQHLPPGK
jgi:CheY-like chemotaxis protein